MTLYPSPLLDALEERGHPAARALRFRRCRRRQVRLRDDSYYSDAYWIGDSVYPAFAVGDGTPEDFHETSGGVGDGHGELSWPPNRNSPGAGDREFRTARHSGLEFCGDGDGFPDGFSVSHPRLSQF